MAGDGRLDDAFLLLKTRVGRMPSEDVSTYIKRGIKRFESERTYEERGERIWKIERERSAKKHTKIERSLPSFCRKTWRVLHFTSGHTLGEIEQSGASRQDGTGQ
jgi:hypothetical protein